MPFLVTVMVKEVIADPPSPKDDQLMETDVAVNCEMLNDGVDGVAAGTILRRVVLAEDGVPLAVVIATTLMLYAVPLVNPLKVKVVCDWLESVAVAVSENAEPAGVMKYRYSVQVPPLRLAGCV